MAMSLRRSTNSGGASDSTINLVIVLLVVIFAGCLLAGLLVLMRRWRAQRQTQAGATGLPSYDDIEQADRFHGNDAKKNTNPRGLTIQTTSLAKDGRSSVVVYGRDGQPMLANPNSPPYSPANVPPIHITFPDEQDEQGHRKSGRVLVVRVGEASIGLEPLHDEEQLPAYEKGNSAQFHSIDMDKIGGLKEKEFQ